ncbi:MAG: general stress protein [Betaproteobacteria bacterium]
MVKTIIGSFDSYDEAQRVVRDLKDEGFMENDVSIVASNAGGRYAAGTDPEPSDRTTTRSDLDPRAEGTVIDTTRRADHDTSGAATGAVTGGVVGGAAGLAVSLMGLAIPGIGPIIAAGPIVAALTGAGVGAVAGGLIGGLTDLGVSEPDAQYYAEAVRRGGALVTVRADETRAEAAADIMRRHGAVDIERRAETWRQSGWSGFDHSAQPYSADEVDRERQAWRSGAGSGSTGTSRMYEATGTTAPAAPSGGMGATERTGSGSYTGAGVAAAAGAAVLGAAGIPGSRPRSSAEWNTYEQEFRSDYETNYAGRGGTFDEYAPAYRHGFDNAQNYRGRKWDDVEPDLQRDWERNHPGREWSRFKNAARRGWQRMSDAIERAVPGDSDRDGK